MGEMKAIRVAYGEALAELGEANEKVVVMDADLAHATMTAIFAIFGAGRAYEQVRNGVAYPNFNVKLGMTHAGVPLGEDGGSHQAIEDMALMRVIPGMTVVVPCDARETHHAVRAVSEMKGPAYLRLARLPSPVFEEDMPFVIGKANVLKEGTDAVVFACGIMVSTVLECAKKLNQKEYPLRLLTCIPLSLSIESAF